jgi:hypothetical protein
LTGHDATIVDTVGNVIKESKLGDVFKTDASEEQLKKVFYVLTLSMCFRNVVQNYPEIFTESPNGDSCLTSYLGNFGKYKYMHDIQPAVYRVHGGGGWSSLSRIKELKSFYKTYCTLSNFYKSKDDKPMVLYFSSQIEKTADKLLYEAVKNGTSEDVYFASKACFSIYFQQRKWKKIFVLAKTLMKEKAKNI